MKLQLQITAVVVNVMKLQLQITTIVVNVMKLQLQFARDPESAESLQFAYNEF